MSEVTFDEQDSFTRAVPSYQLPSSQQTGLIGLLIKKKFAKTRTEANILLLVITLTTIVVSVVVYGVSSRSAPHNDPRMTEWMRQGHVGPVAPDFMPTLK